MRTTCIAPALILLAALPASIAFAQQPAQHAPTAATSQAQAARRYATDATLRVQMREIRGNVLALEHRARGPVTAESTVQLADQVTGHVNTIIAKCELPAEADAALHRIIGPLLQHASALKADPGRQDAVAGMRHALDQYARQFDDPGFSRGTD